jgi:LysR family transcriptional regulator of gallate degradation
MEQRQIELFLAIAERRNVSEAADAMNITQPGLSKSMHRLQRELGVKLYHRRGRGIELTEAGRALHRHGKLIEGQLAEATAEVTGIANGAFGHARIGAGPAWLGRHLPESIAAIALRHPGIRFTVHGGFPDQLIWQLRRGDLDIVVGALPENRTDPDLRFMRLTRDTIRVVGRAGHPLLTKANRTLADYAAQRWVLAGRHELARLRLIRVFRARGLPEPVAVVEADSQSLMLATLRLTDCLGLATTQTLLHAEGRGLAAVDHDLLKFSREAGIIVSRHLTLSPSLKLLVAELRRIAAKRTDN